ncbi:MAG TPA: hypothetical protein VKT82_03240 [Ktedonobacterales bacterium]|nr:hypothetical protein [Ktedonobacterales bacterium]
MDRQNGPKVAYAETEIEARTKEEETGAFSALLAYIEPPQQDFESFARALAKEAFNDPVYEILRKYFLLFSNGYVYWQQSYDYPRIQEYFWVAYMSTAQELRDDLSTLDEAPLLREMFRNISLALVENTYCESSLACNMPRWLRESSTKAEEAMVAALTCLEDLRGLGLEDTIYTPIKAYLNMNLKLYRALQGCAQLYLTSWTNLSHEEIEKTINVVQNQLDLLLPDSRELFSELRAHVNFARRSALGFEERNRTSLRIKQANIILRATTFVGVDLVQAIYKYFDEKGKEPLLDFLIRETGLEFTDVRHGYLNETFETNAGISILRPIVMDLSGEGQNVKFSLPEGERDVDYETWMFRMTMTRFGALSVDFGFSIGDQGNDEPSASVSHVRALEALMGPHMGNIQFEWKKAPKESSEKQFVRPEAVNFVHVYTETLNWINRARDIFPEDTPAYDYYDTYFNFNENARSSGQSAVEKYKTSLEGLRGRLSDISRDKPYIEEPDSSFGTKIFTLSPDLQQVHARYNDLREQFIGWDWIKASENGHGEAAEEEQLRREAQNLFPEGRIFFKLMDIAEEIYRRFATFLVNFSRDEDVKVPFDRDIRTSFYFDRNYGWNSILEVNRLALCDADGNEREPVSDSDFQEIFNHPDFLGFRVTSREARAGLDDWYLASEPPTQRNLATIRSHKNDWFLVEQNRAFVFLPDDPQFIINQYNDTARWAGNIVAALLAHQNSSKTLIEEVETALSDYTKGVRSPEQLRKLRGKIQIFQREAMKMQSLARNVVMTRYVDHSELLRALVKTSRIEFLAGILEENSAILDQLYAHMGDLIGTKKVSFE